MNSYMYTYTHVHIIYIYIAYTYGVIGPRVKSYICTRVQMYIYIYCLHIWSTWTSDELIYVHVYTCTSI